MGGHKNFKILSDPIDMDPQRSKRVEGLQLAYDRQPDWIKHYPLPVCDNCRNIAQYIHCKIVCHVCGMKRDCSDP